MRSPNVVVISMESVQAPK